MTDHLIEPSPVSPAPAGFRETNSGLVVPEEVSREREVWLKDGEERKAFERAQRVAAKRYLSMPLVCYHERCRKNAMGCTILKRVQVAGGYELRCEHKVRVVLG